MFDALSKKIPAHIKLIFKLYGLNLIVFFLIRLCFYFYNQSSDVGTVSFYEKCMGFRMGLEFDTAVFCWIAFLPALVWSGAYLMKKKITLLVWILCFSVITNYASLCKHSRYSLF